jgi:uncharacterized DUF497 family protein
MAAGGPEFDWDEGNVRHLRRHRIAPAEFEEVLLNDPIDLEYQMKDGEARYKALGATNRGRVLIVVWTVRERGIRAVTGYAASRPLRRVYEENRR